MHFVLFTELLSNIYGSRRFCGVSVCSGWRVDVIIFICANDPAQVSALKEGTCFSLLREGEHIYTLITLSQNSLLESSDISNIS